VGSGQKLGIRSKIQQTHVSCERPN